MASRTHEPSEHASTVVRLFPDHAETVIWLSGPVPYDETQLDARLVADLRGWDDSYYAGLTADLSWRSHGAEARFLAEGARLARRLADQIGDDFEVEHDLGESHRRVRGAGPARNPDAAAAFRRRAGQTLEWRADPR